MQLYADEHSPRFADMFRKTVGLTETEFEMVASRFSKQFLPRKYYFLRAGQVCTHIAYIIKGCTAHT